METNVIIELANSKKYYTSKNLSNEEFSKILEIIFMNDTNNLQDIISKNNYTLKNYYVSSNQIYYKFVQENDESNHIEIYSWVSGIMSWNVYRSSNKEFYEDSFYINGSYIINYDITIIKNLNKIGRIYN